MLVFWGFEELLIYPFSLVAGDWRSYQIYFLLIPSFIGAFFVFTIKETPKYLYSKNKIKEAVDVLNWMAKINKKEKRI